MEKLVSASSFSKFQGMCGGDRLFGTVISFPMPNLRHESNLHPSYVSYDPYKARMPLVGNKGMYYIGSSTY